MVKNKPVHGIEVTEFAPFGGVVRHDKLGIRYLGVRSSVRVRGRGNVRVGVIFFEHEIRGSQDLGIEHKVKVDARVS